VPLSEPLRITLEIARVLDDLGVRYLVGGSLASSLHGIPRSTQDADLVADLQSDHVAPLISRLKDAYYIDDERVRNAVRRRASFNAIHLATMTKVDVFVLKGEPFARQEMARRQRISLPEGDGAVLEVATAEDTILQKLAWFTLGGGTSDQQWSDVLGVLKVQQGKLDIAYLRRWAAEVGVEDLLRKAFAEAGLAGAPSE
jgi:hypothetical protein